MLGSARRRSAATPRLSQWSVGRLTGSERSWPRLMLVPEASRAGSPPASRSAAEGPGHLTAPSLAAMFMSGAVLSLLASVLPHGPGVDTPVVAAVASTGIPVALFLWVWGRRLDTWVFHLLLFCGTAIVGLGVYLGMGGGTAVAAAAFYVWITLYAFAFFRWRAATAHLVWAACSFAVALAVSGNPAAPAEWLLIVGTAAVAGMVVGALRDQLHALASTDALTGLPNRQSLDELLERELARAHRGGRPLCLGVIDLDDFKEINDTHGHLVGDRTLSELTEAWKAGLRAGDILVRYGGDEFVVILPDSPAGEAAEVLGRLSAEAHHSWSAGVTALDAGDSPGSLLARADTALYEAKRRGRNQLVVVPEAS